MNSHIWIGILVTSGIMLVSAIAVSSISDVSSASTQSNDIDIEKKSESMDAFFDDDTINVKNTGKYDLEISMFRFYDKLGVEVHRTIIPDMAGRVFGGALPIVKDTILTSTDVYLQSQVPKSYAAADIGIDSFDELSGEILTKRGRTFPILYSEKPGDETGDGQSMIAVMGIQSRIIQPVYAAKLIHGSGVIGEVNSLVPYLPVSSDTDFVGLVENTDRVLKYYIPEFWKSYQFNSKLTDNTPVKPNILIYSDYTSMSGTNNIRLTDDGITLSGTGVVVIKPNVIDNVLLRGTLPEGADVKIVTSPLDLTTLSMSENNYILNIDTNPSKVQTSYSESYHRHVQRGGSSHSHLHISETWNMVSNVNLVVAQDSDLSGTYSTSQICTGIVKFNPCHNIGPGYNPHGKCYYSECHRYHAHYFSGEGNSVFTTSTVPDGIKIIKQITRGNIPQYATTTHTITSTAPYNLKQHFTTNFEQLVPLPTNSYIVVALNGENITLKGESISANPHFLSIQNLDENIPYKIIKDKLPIITGMTDSSGGITINNLENAPSVTSGILHLYPDSLSYRGAFSTVILDKHNSQTIHIESMDDKVYTVHAYVNVPVTGNVTISNTHLTGDGTLLLSYLNGNYTVGNAIKVPVIPGYSTINLTLNGVTTQLNYADVLGGTGIKIAESAASTITNNDLDSRISSITATAGTPAFVIATSDGVISAIMSETISGAITITNTYTLQAIPPPPPPPQPRDPLEGFVEIHVNGVLIKTETLGINPNPAFSSRNTVSGTSALQSVTYKYPDYSLAGNASVDVNVGDFVEFYLYGKIYGEIDGYSPPGGFTIIGERGTAAATINIRSAHIQTSQ